jgi:16S rRNA processing protein RimM
MNIPPIPHKPIVVGKVLTTHGVHGQLKIQSMMDIPAHLGNMTPFWINSVCYARWELLKPTGKADIFLGRLAEIHTMDQADMLRHHTIIVDRSQLPPIDGAIYYTDMEEKEVIDVDGVPMGQVLHVHDFGAGPILELNPSGIMVSFYDLIAPEAPVLQLKYPSSTFC